MPDVSIQHITLLLRNRFDLAITKLTSRRIGEVILSNLHAATIRLLIARMLRQKNGGIIIEMTVI